MSNVRVRLLIVCLFIVAVVLLQIYLSKMKNKWAGLVLPTISFLFALLYPLNLLAPAGGVDGWFITQMFIVWVLANIPTILLAVIYAKCRSHRAA